MYENIVVAFDGTDGARTALQGAVALAAGGGGTVHLIHSTGHLNYAEQGIVSEPTEAQAAARVVLEDAAGQLEEVPVTTRIVAGDPVAGIIAAAEEVHADLIVTGSRGRAVMPEAVLGRVTSGIVSNAPCDVLVVQPAA